MAEYEVKKLDVDNLMKQIDISRDKAKEEKKQHVEHQQSSTTK